jgi:3-hydroxyacyl-CoA dehydrogenase
VREIRKVAVLGAGTMGARIAAHLANAGIPSYLLDIVPKELSPEEQKRGLTLADPRVRNRFAQAGLDAALKSRPAAFFVPEAARWITLGNFEDNLGWIKDSDWIIEAVTEDLAIKRALLEKVRPLRAPHAMVSSNTSGISIASIAEGFDDDFRRHWLGTHFFNPPRYMKLLEVISTRDTLPDVVEAVTRFGDVVLGKGIVIAKDTPNFIANRIGTFTTLNVLRVMTEGGYSIEEVDSLTGPAMGLPKSATFRTLDIVGLDVLVHVVKNLAAALPDDERREVFVLPDFVNQMMERKLLGEKTRQGFYRKTKGEGGESEILTLDFKTFEYRARQKWRATSKTRASAWRSCSTRRTAPGSSIRKF